MLAEPKLKALRDLVQASTKEELVWMNGFLAGLLSNGSADNAVAQPQPVDAAPAVDKITIAYGTESGNSKKLATDFAARAKKSGIKTKLVSLDQYRLNDLVKEEYFFTIISTQGEGEPPATAKKFYDHIHHNGFRFDKLKYSVLALGDTSYPLYCKAGEDVDIQLKKMGGECLVPLQKCDVDYQADADTWIVQVLQSLSSNGQQPGAVAAAPVTVKKATGKKIYSGTILSNVNLNDRGSIKETHHIEIAAEELDYQPGDSIGIVAQNNIELVEEIMALTGIDAAKNQVFRDQPYSVQELLQKKLNIVYLPERVVKQYAAVVEQDIPAMRISLYDLLKIYPVKDAAHFEKVLGILEPITPRLYSIASSPEAHEGEVHLTVARDTFFVEEELKCGLCSGHLCDLQVDAPLEFYVHRNHQFRLPPPDKDVIMIGPGTGIAPFRSFLSERDASGATGRNWLFFGDQHFQSDFLYQTEIQNWVQTGVLTKVSLAFSRDQSYKIYVQHRMLEHAIELWQWIDAGAYIYVCGAKDPMSVDVEYALLQVIERLENKSSQEALDYLDQLKEAGRYVKDVY